jgi:hypothetical protein
MRTFSLLRELNKMNPELATTGKSASFITANRNIE